MNLSTVSQSEITTTTRVVLLHRYGKPNLDRLVRNEGLKNFSQLLREGKVNSRYKSLPDQNDLIYFRYVHGMTRERIPENMVGIEVNPTDHFVHNQEFRAAGNLQLYNDSKLPLIDYMKKKELAQQMGCRLIAGDAIIFHPLSASPMICKYNQVEHRIIQEGYYDLASAGLVGWGQYEVLYLNEVTFKMSNIPAENLIFHKNEGNSTQ